MTKHELKETRLTQIIEAAIQEFVERGFHTASLRSIADRAGISKGGIYHHFRSKDEILIEVNNRFKMGPINRFMGEARAEKSPLFGLTHFIENYLTFWSQHPREMVFIFLSLAKFLDTPELWPEMDGYAQYMISFYEELLSNGIEAGEFEPHDCRGRATILFSSIDGIIGYIVMSQAIDTRETIRQFIDLFIKGIEK